jgi:hypothetical protein
MTRNEILQRYILGVGLAEPDFCRATNISELWRGALEKCFDCSRAEVLDALYTFPREHASLIKFVSEGEGLHLVSFERVRNTKDWPEYFTTGTFYIKVLAEGSTWFRQHSELLQKPIGR